MAKREKKSAPVYQLPPEKTLNALMRLGRKTQKEMQGLSGELGAAIANAVENNHVHRKALSFVRQCDRMTAEKLAEFKAHFDDYYVKCGLQEREDSAERLPMGEDESDNDKKNGKAEDKESSEAAGAVH